MTGYRVISISFLLHNTLLILSSVHHSLLINHKIFDIYLTTKAFRAIAPSSVAFYWQLEQFNITKDPKLRKWKWPLSPESKSGNFHQETHEESTVKKIQLDPPVLIPPCAPSSSPPLPQVPPYWGLKGLLIRPSCPLVAPVSYLLTHEGEAADFHHN